MVLHISRDTVVGDVQKQFNTLYPFLQLQFFKPVPPQNGTSYKLQKTRRELPSTTLRPSDNPVSLSVANEITVACLLERFTQLGLLAQVCRKSGNLWVETSLTDDWTLARQNTEAMLISMPYGKLPAPECSTL